MGKRFTLAVLLLTFSWGVGFGTSIEEAMVAGYQLPVARGGLVASYQLPVASNFEVTEANDFQKASSGNIINDSQLQSYTPRTDNRQLTTGNSTPRTDSWQLTTGNSTPRTDNWQLTTGNSTPRTDNYQLPTGNSTPRTDNRQLTTDNFADSSLLPRNIFHLRLDSISSTVPLNYNNFVQHYIDIYTERKTQIGKMLGLSKYYFPIFENALVRAGVPAEIKYITIVESALNPHAVSRSGAVGPWQFMFATAKGYGLTMDSYVDERKDPVKASAAAAHYLVDAYKRIGDWLLTIAAFNCGTGAVLRAIERSGGVADFWLVRPFLPKETQNYVPAFIATMYVMNYHREHGIDELAPEYSLFTDVIDVTKRLPISSIAKAADLDLKELLYFNPSYKKQIINGSENSPKTLVVPQISRQSYAALYDVLNGSSGSAQVIAASTQAPESNLTAETVYRVKPGQTLIHIANIHGVEVQDLKVWNNLKSTTIVPGQGIKIKKVGSSPYPLQRGKTDLEAPLKRATIDRATTLQKSTTDASTAAKIGAQPETPSYITYIVKAGDTLSEIASRFKGTTVAGIKALNGLSRSTLQPGMSLKINRG